MRKLAILGMILSSIPSGAQTTNELRGPKHGWLSDALTVATASTEEEVTGEGRVRKLADIEIGKVRFFTDPSEGKTILLRVANDGAAGVRLHFENMRVSRSARLYVYGVDEANQVIAAHGPFNGGGPLDSGDFWTPSMAGVAVIVELQLAAELTTLPFDLEEMALADTVDGPRTLPTEPTAADKRTSRFRGVVVEHQVVDGMAILEGDIILGRIEEMEAVREGKKDDERLAGSLTGTAYKWPNGVMPYVIDSALPNQSRITAAITHWNTKLNGYVKLVPRTNETYYVRFQPASATTCSSYLGMIRQSPQVINVGDYCSTGNMIHEIGHAFGLYHEQARSDRDNYVKINSQNVEPDALSNFSKQSSSNHGSYDYGSIMHYGAYAFSRNDLPTIETIPAGIPIGQRSGLSTGDVTGMQDMYPSTAPPSTTNVTVSFSSNPAGRLLTVDGSTAVSPRSVQWAVGSSHTISAPNQTSGTTKYVFKQWSDGGAQTHTVAPRAATTYTATYNPFYKLAAAAADGGRVSVSPAASDSFYAAGSVVTLTATPDANYCLTSWSGVMPISSYAIAVTLNRAAEITANFQVGSVTATGGTVPNAGGLFRLNIAATSGCLWRAVSQASWITIEGASTGSASAPLLIRVAAGTPGTRRSGTILVNSRRVTITQLP